MATVLEYMKFSLNVYSASTANLIGVPLGWTRTDWQPDMPSGFSAGTFVKGNDVIISYTGTNGGLDYLNWGIGGGLPLTQIYDAIDYFFAAKAAHPGKNITFTGHSLGGGLASLMAIYFDKQATTFDEAPFQLAAMSPIVKENVSIYMDTKVYIDSAFGGYVSSWESFTLTRRLSDNKSGLEAILLLSGKF